MSTQAEVQVSYDVGNEFFRLWLDKRMNYTCGIYDETDDLDEAQPDLDEPVRSCPTTETATTIAE